MKHVQQRPSSACAAISSSCSAETPQERGRTRPASATVRTTYGAGAGIPAEIWREDAGRLQSRPASARPSSAMSKGASEQHKLRPASAFGIGTHARNDQILAGTASDLGRGACAPKPSEGADEKLPGSLASRYTAEDLSDVLYILRGKRSKSVFEEDGKRATGRGGPESTCTATENKSLGEPCPIDAGFFAFQGPGVVAYKFEGGRSVEYIRKTKVLPEGIQGILDTVFSASRSADVQVFRGPRTGESSHAHSWHKMHKSAEVKRLDVVRDKLFEEARHAGTRIQGSLFRRKGELADWNAVFVVVRA